jgi:hypothetical protein
VGKNKQSILTWGIIKKKIQHSYCQKKRKRVALIKRIFVKMIAEKFPNLVKDKNL